MTQSTAILTRRVRLSHASEKNCSRQHGGPSNAHTNIHVKECYVLAHRQTAAILITDRQLDLPEGFIEGKLKERVQG